MSHAEETIEFSECRYQITRVLNVPVERAWQFWTVSRHLRQWHCPIDFTVEDVIVDLKEGGTWQVKMRAQDDSTYCTSGTYQEIVENRRLVFTQTWEDSDHQSVITVEFEALGQATKIIFSQAYLESDEARDSHAEGWSETLDNLKRSITS